MSLVTSLSTLLTKYKRTTLVIKQVSYHPPITAYQVANASREFTLEGQMRKEPFSQVGCQYLVYDLLPSSSENTSFSQAATSL